MSDLQELIQLTGKNHIVGQRHFPKRTPADPAPFEDPLTKEVYIYGTQVDGTGFNFLKYRSKSDLFEGLVEPELIEREVALPNGKPLRGQEAIWDTYRLSYAILENVFSPEILHKAYQELGVDPQSDLYYGGIALQENGELGRWTTDNWRRRVHVMAEKKGQLHVLAEPVFNPIPAGKTELEGPGYGHLAFLPGDYIGHAYGANFKLIQNPEGRLELWLISEEVTRRVVEEGLDVEVTEVVARRMESPFKASAKGVLLVSVNNEEGLPHKDSDRGPSMSHTKLIEGFRPAQLAPHGIQITKRAVPTQKGIELIEDLSLSRKEYYFLIGSAGNFASDDYGTILAYRESSAIGPYQVRKDSNKKSWKRFLSDLKLEYDLSWAGRGAFLNDDQGHWYLLFHAVEKKIKPDGSYSGIIPHNTDEYHRNLYLAPIEFFLNLDQEPDMRVVRRHWN